MIRKGDQLKNQLFTLVLYITVIKWYVSQVQAALRLFFFIILEAVLHTEYSVHHVPAPNSGLYWPIFYSFKCSKIQCL